MKKVIHIISLIIPLCLSCETNNQQTPLNLITVTGIGEVRLRPDNAAIVVGVETRAVVQDQARLETDIIAAAVISYLQSQGIEDKDIQTSYLSLSPYYPYVSFDSETEIDNTQPLYYTAQKTTTFILRNLSRYDDIMEGLYNAGINRVESITFGMENIQEYEDEARRRAAADAIQQATDMAGALGLTIRSVYFITEDTNNAESPDFGGEVVDNAQAQATPTIASGQFVVTSNVDATFQLI